MKTTVFQLSEPGYCQVEKLFNIYDVLFQIPILPAYSILHYSLDYQSSEMTEVPKRYEAEIEGDNVRVKSVQSLFLGGDSGVLTIHYSGIRDYKLYFPQIKNKRLCTRLAEFSEEAEKCFESGAWMAFTVMVASVVEGLLFNHYHKETLFNLINRAKEDGLVCECDAVLLHEAREIRNRVHAGNFEQEFPGRTIGNDLYVLYDKLIKKKWV